MSTNYYLSSSNYKSNYLNEIIESKGYVCLKLTNYYLFSITLIYERS